MLFQFFKGAPGNGLSMYCCRKLCASRTDAVDAVAQKAAPAIWDGRRELSSEVSRVALTDCFRNHDRYCAGVAGVAGVAGALAVTSGAATGLIFTVAMIAASRLKTLSRSTCFIAPSVS
jgi:hypothetical protein